MNFTQVNPKINQVMISPRNTIITNQKPNENNCRLFFVALANFYAAHSPEVARKCLGLEGLSNLVDRANESAALNTISNVYIWCCRFI